MLPSKSGYRQILTILYSLKAAGLPFLLGRLQGVGEQRLVVFWAHEARVAVLLEQKIVHVLSGRVEREPGRTAHQQRHLVHRAPVNVDLARSSRSQKLPSPAPRAQRRRKKKKQLAKMHLEKKWTKNSRRRTGRFPGRTGECATRDRCADCWRPARNGCFRDCTLCAGNWSALANLFFFFLEICIYLGLLFAPAPPPN